MKRNILLLSIFLLATLISGWVNLAEAQQPGKVPRDRRSKIPWQPWTSLAPLEGIPARATRSGLH